MCIAGEQENGEDVPYVVQDKRYICRLCGAFFLGRRSLALHMQNSHNMSINKKFTLSGNEVRSLVTHPAAAGNNLSVSGLVIWANHVLASCTFFKFNLVSW